MSANPAILSPLMKTLSASIVILAGFVGLGTSAMAPLHPIYHSVTDLAGITACVSVAAIAIGLFAWWIGIKHEK